MAKVLGFEPRLTVLETVSLPLTDTNILVPDTRVELVSHDYKSCALTIELVGYGVDEEN